MWPGIGEILAPKRDLVALRDSKKRILISRVVDGVCCVGLIFLREKLQKEEIYFCTLIEFNNRPFVVFLLIIKGPFELKSFFFV